MNLQQYQELSKRTMPFNGAPANHMEEFYAVNNFALGLTGEAGEVADLIKKKYHHGHEVAVNEIKNELGDVLFYIAGLATICGIDLEDVAQSNVDKLKERYPNGFNKEDSIKRIDVNG